MHYCPGLLFCFLAYTAHTNRKNFITWCERARLEMRFSKSSSHHVLLNIKCPRRAHTTRCSEILNQAHSALPVSIYLAHAPWASHPPLQVSNVYAPTVATVYDDDWLSHSLTPAHTMLTPCSHQVHISCIAFPFSRDESTPWRKLMRPLQNHSETM